jgi:diguanylate cyclase (GGDEF)-like protein
MWGVSLLAGIAAVVAIAQLSLSQINWTAFLTLLFLATVAQLFQAEAPNNVIYYATPVFVFAGALLIQPGLFIVIALVPALVEWVNEAYRKQNQSARSSWFVLPFNIALDIISGLVARFFYGVLITFAGGDLASMICGISAAACFMLVNHLLLGVGLVLRGRAWRETGLLNLESSLSDLTLLILGFIVAEIWKHNPWLILPAISPLILMYRALLVPKLKQEAQTDPKTGLLNARYFATRFAENLSRAQRSGAPLALIVADLDYLRTINNTYGHLAGDAVLIGVGKIIGSHVGEGSMAARFGGEEFAIVLDDTGQGEAVALAERIRREIAEHTFTISSQEQPIRATMSFGVACFPDDGQTTTNLFQEADIATYHAKVGGRNRVISVRDLPHAVRVEGIPLH